MEFDVTELEEFTPKTPVNTEFPWDHCGFEPPAIDCSEFKDEVWHGRQIVGNVNHVDKMMYFPVEGSCWTDYKKR